jgi:glycosyltransferase involved in cell wall biosynthesis
MKIAFVYDWVNKFGGAERVLEALHDIWPQAPIYTAVYNKKKAAWANNFSVYPSFLQKIPIIRDRQELLPLMTPVAFESFDFRGYDVVISVTSADAKAVITTPPTLHICYCLTPTRYLWSGFPEYLRDFGIRVLKPMTRMLMKLIIPEFRRKDYIMSHRPDIYLSISKTVAHRLKTYYHVDSQVVYPPVNTSFFNLESGNYQGEFYLIVSRLVPYKRIDYTITAFNRMGKKLVIIGDGVMKKKLKKIAKDNIKFVSGDLTDKKLSWYYHHCSALIFPGEEDFGLSAVEAQACGKPVIGYNRGGVTESVIPGATGLFYSQQSREALTAAVMNFNEKKFSPDKCRKNALRFSRKIFQTTFSDTISRLAERR